MSGNMFLKLSNEFKSSSKQRLIEIAKLNELVSYKFEIQKQYDDLNSRNDQLNKTIEKYTQSTGFNWELR